MEKQIQCFDDAVSALYDHYHIKGDSDLSSRELDKCYQCIDRVSLPLLAAVPLEDLPDKIKYSSSYKSYKRYVDSAENNGVSIHVKVDFSLPARETCPDTSRYFEEALIPLPIIVNNSRARVPRSLVYAPDFAGIIKYHASRLFLSLVTKESEGTFPLVAGGVYALPLLDRDKDKNIHLDHLTIRPRRMIYPITEIERFRNEIPAIRRRLEETNETLVQRMKKLLQSSP